MSEIDVENIKAAYENGVLTLTMPKKAPVKPETKIKIYVYSFFFFFFSLHSSSLNM